jgi:hypothetical protein
MILEVVSIEGPVSKETILGRVRTAWGLNRAGGRIRTAFDDAVRTLQRKRLVVSRPDGFYDTPETKTLSVRGGDPDRADTIRTIDDVPRDELREAMRRLVRDVHTISEDELTSRVAGIFGWSRRGPDIASALRRVVSRLILDGDLVRTPTGIVPGQT